MTLDEAIIHEKELSEKDYLQGMLCHANPNDEKLDEYIEHGRYHEQVAEWLKDYKRLKELFSKTFIKDCNTCEQEIYQKAYKEGQDKGFSDGHFFGYKKAIDDIVIKIKERVGMDWEWDFIFIEQIAELLNVGEQNE